MNDNIHVTKRNGDIAAFDPRKLKRALQSAGADNNQQKEVLEKLKPNLYDGIPTQKIYRLAFNLLKHESHKVAGRYKLKSAIMELGPTGFPFERFVGRIFEALGYEVQTGVTVQGKCVSHEVDVIARKPNEMLMIECKFHSDDFTKSSVQVPLYIHSRFLDVKATWEEQYGKDIRYRGGVVTNTRFSDDAASYGNCAGMLMVSWDTPQGHSLKDRIDRSGLHPLTSLISLTKAQKQQLLEHELVLCSELASHRHLLEQMHISERQINKILREAASLIKS